MGSRANESDIIVIGLQECGPVPQHVFPEPVNLPNREEYLRYTVEEDFIRDREFLHMLCNVLASTPEGERKGFRLVADVAMGEPACVSILKP